MEPATLPVAGDPRPGVLRRASPDGGADDPGLLRGGAPDPGLLRHGGGAPDPSLLPASDDPCLGLLSWVADAPASSMAANHDSEDDVVGLNSANVNGMDERTIDIGYPGTSDPNCVFNIDAGIERVDWASLQIVQGRDEEGRDVPMEEDEMFVFLGLRAEDDRANERRNVGIEQERNNVLPDVEGAAIPVDDVIPKERHFSYDMDHPEITIGTMYPTMDQFRLAIRQYAINEEFELGIKKSDRSRFVGYCKSDGCPWRILARVTPDGTAIRVNRLVEEHDCSSTSRIRSSMANCQWVASKAVSILRTNPNMGTKKMQEMLQDDHNVTIGYDTVWRGRERALNEIYGSWEGSFQLLYNFKAEVELRSPGSIVEIDTKSVKGNVYFHRLFIAFRPCIDGFLNGCRPYISIDSTALNGKWNGHLAAVTALDGHNWMFPVAFGLIQAETNDNWTWFMSQLKRAIGEPPLLAVCTDACKGLENVVKSVFPQAEQRECFRHLMENFVKKFHGDIPNNMWPAARAYKSDVFDYHMDLVLQKCPQVAEYLGKYHNMLWMRCMFNPDIKCDYVNNNLAECFNSWVKGIKDLPVVELADKIRGMVMELFDKRRRRIGQKLEGYILPAVILQTNARSRGLGHLKVNRSADWSAEVRDTNKGDLRHVVKTLEMECTCQEWQHTRKPCQHALAFLTTQRNVKMDRYIHEYYSVHKFRAAYQGQIEPLTDKSQWPKVNLDFVLLPPLAKRSSGRPRKLRIKGCLENGGKGKNKYKRCGELGHRQATCPLNGTKKRKRKPTKRNTSTSQASTPTRANVSIPQQIIDSPGVMTRRMLAQAMGEGPSQPAMTSSPVKAKKISPRKKKK